MISNFETCPHCTAKGYSAIMMRLRGHTPLITRSDGKSYHLLLFAACSDAGVKSSGTGMS
jgi:hypothetical protein